MIFTATALPGAVVIEPEPVADQRGFFARAFCASEFTAHGLDPRVEQCNISFNAAAGTLRGLHFQHPPHAEAKLVRCTAGRVYDVIVDLRPQSPTFRHHVAVELSARTRTMLYVPEGCAHGFQTLADDSEVFYQMSAPFHAAAAAGVRWDDPAFGIAWPLPVSVISERDRRYADFDAGAWRGRGAQ